MLQCSMSAPIHSTHTHVSIAVRGYLLETLVTKHCNNANFLNQIMVPDS